MNKYKIGDIAALFPPPKEPKSESGRKLQSLFRQFNSKKSKPQTQPNKIKEEKKAFQPVEDFAISSKKDKKRKFSSDVHSHPQKFKKQIKLEPEEHEQTNSLNFKEKRKDKLEIDFPRKKKKVMKFDTNFDRHSTENSPVKQNKKSISKAKEHSPVKSFIKKAKDENINASNIFKIDGSKSQSSLPKYKLLNNNSLLKKNLTDSDMQVIKIKRDVDAKLKKKRNKIEKKEKNVIKISKKLEINKSSNITNKASMIPNQSDFICVPDGEETELLTSVRRFYEYKNDVEDDRNEDSEEVLKRTLFVGNLPANSNRKALQRLFSTFGPVVRVRYHPIETSRKKIFQNDGKTLTESNFAGTSIPAYIVFKERESAVNALALSGSIFENRHITVDFAVPAGTQKIYDEKRSIFIGNLPFAVLDESIWNAFSECGKIEAVRVIRDPKTGIGKGFGYVLFSTVLGKEKALSWGEIELDERKIRIKSVEPKKNQNKSRTSAEKFDKMDSFKSRAIKARKALKESKSRKSVKKIMKRNKNLHKKKKIAAMLQKS